MVTARERRAVRNAGGGRRMAEEFYRPRRRVRPGVKSGELQGVQLDLFPDEINVGRPDIKPRDLARPLADWPTSSPRPY
jgi:hypothetical protein